MFNALDFLKLAEELKRSTDEAKIRTAISRAYYAAFLLSREWLRVKGWNIYDAAEDHKEVPKGLKKYCGRITGDQLGLLYRDHRGHADYNLTKSFNIIDADTAVNLAKVIISKCYP